MSTNRGLAQDALNGLGAELGTQLAFDENGVITLEFAGDVTCSIEQPADSDRLHFHAVIARMPSVDRERALADALSLNLFRLSLPGSAVALDRDDDEVLLCYSAQCDQLASDSLPEILVAIATEVQRLRTNLREAAKSDTATPDPALRSIDEDLIDVIRA